MNCDVMFSSNTDQWSTPQWFFDELNKEFHFDLDVCADELNHKCEQYFNEQQDGLKMKWGGANMVQSTLRKTDRFVGEKSISSRHASCNVSSSKNGHEMVS